ncbi:transmembrane protein [Perilla frutescens var. frutescens]|nr:transmembrane protein [Perilla frutescens var. frutescens]
MEQGAIRRNSRFSAHDKRLLAIGFAVLAVLSPLYIDRRSVPEPELEEEPVYFSSYLPLLQLVLIMAIAVSGFMERGFTGLDPYWIHRAGGSSTGIIVVLIILMFVLKWKAY